jgi:hypothetical protein
VTGNQWFRFVGRLTGEPGTQRIELHWPPDDEALKAQMEYGGTANFTTSIHRTIHTSTDTLTWRPVEGVEVNGQRVRFEVDLSTKELYVAVGIPYLPSDLSRLFAELAASRYAQIEEIARTKHRRPVRAIRIGPCDGGKGAFYLQGLQHVMEWAGPRILSSMARYLVSDAGAHLRQEFTFHLVPAMNVDGLYSWREAPQGNMNRDWTGFDMIETAGARDYIKRLLARGDRLLHVLDLHMGWSNAERSGASLTAYPEGMAPEDIIQTQLRLAEHIFARTEWTDHIWRASHWNGTTCAFWALYELGLPGQTAENSRHLVQERDTGEWVRITQAHEEQLGRDLAEALCSFDW